MLFERRCRLRELKMSMDGYRGSQVMPEGDGMIYLWLPEEVATAGSVSRLDDAVAGVPSALDGGLCLRSDIYQSSTSRAKGQDETVLPPLTITVHMYGNSMVMIRATSLLLSGLLHGR